MAYFANNTEAAAFEAQCARCKYGEEMCPIFVAQITYNYDCNNSFVREILNELVKDNGTCKMFEMFKEDFEIKEQ